MANSINAQVPQDDIDSDDDEEFLYPGASVYPESEHVEVPQRCHPAQLESSCPGASMIYSEPEPEHAEVPRQRNPPSPAQLESLCAAASSGDLPLLKRLFRNALETGDVEPFRLANDTSSRTGFTALHVAASRGYLDMVMWRKMFLGRAQSML